MKNKALGRGLKALIPDTPRLTPRLSRTIEIASIRITEIRPNPQQPRERFDPMRLNELTQSIRARGVIQPVVVRRRAVGFELIAGERRLRAAQSAGYTEIPAIVRDDIADRDALELSLLENLQRDDLNPVEEAQAYQRLATIFGLTQDAIAQTVGKDRSTIANAIRLLKLPPTMLAALREGTITMGHAKALLSLDDPHQQQRLFKALLQRTVTSVRDTEARAASTGQRSAAARRDPQLIALEEELAKALGTRVRILHRRGQGKVVIEYYSLDDLERLRHILHGPRAVLS